MHTYREVLALPEFRVLFLVRCVTMAAISIGSLALGATTYASTGSPVLTALSMFGGPLITLLGSATVLSASDAMGPRRASTIMPIAYSVAFLLQALPNLSWGLRFAILAMPFLAGSATSGSFMRLMHEILPPDGFVLGRATLNIAVGVMQVAGYGLGGVMLVWLSVSSLFLVAGATMAVAVAALRFGLRERPGVASDKGLLTRTRDANRALLGSPTTRPVYLALWVPNGLIVGCEALFVPYAGHSGAGYLFAATAAGMLLGDVVVGRFLPPRHRDRLVGPLRMLLALPYLGFFFAPPPAIALACGFVASIGFSASLLLQERLVRVSGPDSRGQAFGLYSTGLMVGQAVGATIGGLLATWLGPAYAMGALAVASLCSTVALAPGLRRSAPAPDHTTIAH
ncbi:membrane protein [Actinoplanes lobatus]|uniref:Membrane protein n=1 Tax=Actinoplanes lobatus TaxID=113568 RepID=A0A7W7HJP3_9ACTN|nr:MFS transporter [Actinoplanes lobatus]MBB4751783.1 putative MFS family arabinose efflux permease [Actinoplanes lobatus]GGN65713.1 membrane protein [Actinoplanes lobatus]GIE43363.1 membrane protein [Actinoplanes lobatus]